MKTYRNFLYVLLAIAVLVASSCKPEEIDPDDPDNQKTVESLAGEWVRVLSNNPGSDGMKLTVAGNKGTLTDKAGSGFAVGDVKWNDLQQADKDFGYDFLYQELGSDYNYYASTMTITEDSAILNVNHTGAGNIQKWVRKSKWTDPGPSNDPILLTCDNISTATTWTNGPSAVDYVVPSGCVLDITDVLEIEAGTVIEFEENSGLGIYDNGALKAIGTDTEMIVLRGKENVQGLWRGIHIETNTLNNQLDYVKIQNAGSNYVYCCNAMASLFVKGAKISIKHTEITDGDGIGLYVANGSDLREYQEVRVSNHNDYPVWISMEGTGQLDGKGSDYSGNTKDYIFVSDDNVDETVSMPAVNVPYLLEGKVIDITEKLTIQAGAELVFEENGGLGIYDNGAFTVKGTATQPVIMRGLQPVRAYWRGIHVETNSLGNDIDHAMISDAGSNYVYCCNDKASLFLKAGILSLQNSTIQNGGGYGIVTKTLFSFNNFENNKITSHKEQPITLSIEQTGQLDGMGSDYRGNEKDFLLIYNSDLTSAITVPKTNVPYSVETNKVLDIKASMTIEAGTEFAFESESGLGIYDNGVLTAVGTAGEKIIFRGLDNVKGYWRGIHLETTNNMMDYVEVRNAASNYVYCCNDKAGVILKSGDLTLTNSNISDNDGCGVIAKAAATLTESSNTFFNNTDGDICN